MNLADVPRRGSKLTTAVVVAVAGVALTLAGCGGTALSTEPLEEAAAQVATDAPSSDVEVSVLELVPLLTRYGVGPYEVGIDLTFAPKLFFDVTGLAIPQEALERPTLMFIMQENIHEGDFLSAEPSEVFLLSSDGERIPPYMAVVTAYDPHHRVVRLLFPKLEEQDHLRIVVPFGDGSVTVANTFDWRLPIEVGGVVEQDTEG